MKGSLLCHTCSKIIPIDELRFRGPKRKYCKSCSREAHLRQNRDHQREKRMKNSIGKMQLKTKKLVSTLLQENIEEIIKGIVSNEINKKIEQERYLKIIEEEHNLLPRFPRAWLIQ